MGDIQSQMADLLAAVRLVERSLTMIVDDLDDIREQQQRDREALIRLQEQLGQVRDTMRQDRRTAVQTRGQHVQAAATIIGGIVGALAGIASLIWNIFHR